MWFSPRPALLILGCIAMLGVAGCDSIDPAAPVSFSIVVASSGPSRTASFAGTYEYFIDGQRTTRDLTGEGTRSVIFDAQTLEFVRLHGASADNLYSLTISREGKVIFESRSVAGRQPILYHAKSPSGDSREQPDI